MRKTLLATALLFAVCTGAIAQTWHTANQATIAWNAVTTLEDDSAIPASDVVKYQIYLKDEAGTITPQTEVDAAQATITFTIEGRYYIGVSAVRYNAAGDKLSESTTTWSDDPQGAPGPFGFTFYQKPVKPLGLRTQ